MAAHACTAREVGTHVHTHEHAEQTHIHSYYQEYKMCAMCNMNLISINFINYGNDYLVNLLQER